MAVIAFIIQAIRIFRYLLIGRVVLNWFMPADNPIIVGLGKITDPYVNIVRDILPPSIRVIGMFDISFVVAYFLLYLIESAMINFLIAI